MLDNIKKHANIIKTESLHLEDYAEESHAVLCGLQTSSESAVEEMQSVVTRTTDTVSSVMKFLGEDSSRNMFMK